MGRTCNGPPHINASPNKPVGAALVAALLPLHNYPKGNDAVLTYPGVE